MGEVNVAGKVSLLTASGNDDIQVPSNEGERTLAGINTEDANTVMFFTLSEASILVSLEFCVGCGGELSEKASDATLVEEFRCGLVRSIITLLFDDW